MHIRCPHCQSPFEIVDVPGGELLCPSCGSSFRLEQSSTVTHTALLPREGPRRMGRFELLEVVGTGAFGTVYKACDPELDRVVALKVPRADNVGDAAHRDRFLREARSAAQLRHPRIVPVHEVGLVEDLPFLVSDFVSGLPLSDRLAAQRFAPREAADLIAELAAALHYAHTHGVIHRDVKPSNVMLDEAGRPHLMDFGLAKREAGEIVMTLDGQVLGTPAYMSPEQARGEGHRVDGRADVYSLGVMLYQMLTGELPFRGSTRILLHQVLHDEPRPPRVLNDRVPRDLETVCLKAMAKDAGRRYQTAADLEADLRRFLKGEPIHARPVGRLERGWRWCRRNPALAGACSFAAVALLAVALVSTILAIHQTQARNALGREQEKTAAALHQSQMQSAGLALDQGQALCERGEVAHGMLWMARSLEIAPVDAADLRRAIRTNLGAWRPHIHPLKAVLPHQSAVQAVAFHPDGNTIATACFDRAVRLWNAETGQPMGQPMRHDDHIFMIDFSPDGTKLASSSADQTARLWDAASGKPIGKPMRHKSLIDAVAFSPDSTRVLTGGGDGIVQLWDATTGEPIGSPLANPGRVLAVSFSPDGKTLAAADSTLRLWDAAMGKLLHEMPNPTLVIRLAFSPDGKWIVAAAGNSAVLRDVATGKAVGPTYPHHAAIYDVAFSPDSKTLLTASVDHTARLWETATGKAIGPPLQHEDMVTRALFRADGKAVATSSYDGSVRVWDAATGEPWGAALRHQGPVRSIAFSPEGRSLATASFDGKARIWDVSAARRPGHVLPGDNKITGLAYSPDSKTVAVASDATTARLQDADSGQPIGEPMPHNHRVQALAFSPDGKWVLSGSKAGDVRLWDATTARLVRKPLQLAGQVSAVAFSPTGETFLTGNSLPKGGAEGRLWETATGRSLGRPMPMPQYIYDAAFRPDGKALALACGNSGEGNVARLWDAATGAPLGPPLVHKDPVLRLVFSPDSRRLLTASFDKEARLWDATSGESIGQPWRHDGPVRAVAFSPDGTLAATAGDDEVVRLWQVATGKKFGPPLQHHGGIRAVAFSPDGSTLLAGGNDGTARLWNLKTGKLLGPALRHRDGVLHVVFAPDGKSIATGSIDRTARLRRIPPSWDEDPERIALTLQAATGLELDSSGALLALSPETWQQRCRRLRESRPRQGPP